MNEWISVKDRLPEKGKDVLCVDHRGAFIGCFSDGIWYDVDSCNVPVTHWMPLPELPK
jgi:hypothetical protein